MSAREARGESAYGCPLKKKGTLGLVSKRRHLISGWNESSVTWGSVRELNLISGVLFFVCVWGCGVWCVVWRMRC
jgi:hypothetical protein